MIVVSDTTPIISLLKIDCLDLLNMLFGEILIPKIVYEELITNIKYSDEAKGRLVAKQMGLTIMGTIGILMTAYDKKLLSANDVQHWCIRGAASVRN